MMVTMKVPGSILSYFAGQRDATDEDPAWWLMPRSLGSPLMGDRQHRVVAASLAPLVGPWCVDVEGCLTEV